MPGSSSQLLPVGPYGGETFESVMQNDPEYCQSVLSQENLDPELQDFARFLRAQASSSKPPSADAEALRAARLARSSSAGKSEQAGMCDFHGSTLRQISSSASKMPEPAKKAIREAPKPQASARNAHAKASARLEGALRRIAELQEGLRPRARWEREHQDLTQHVFQLRAAAREKERELAAEPPD
ncbi:unnamed protein product [Effrenium voratum]|nr:unnamed protein product [Effrenium voratum]